ncbi:MAG: hypothetical protein GXY42_08580 [Desulfovibrionales bacterium]|nr:hypothetical protein [Desulfovibrionales bacterium]
MKDDKAGTSFRLAPMSPLSRTCTLFLLALPPTFLIAALYLTSVLTELTLITLLFTATYIWIWLWFRPTRFIVHRGGIEVCWPLKRREIAQEDISNVRLMDVQQLKREIGWGVRIGAGGLWGGFGWLWTKRRGVVQMYVSRTDGYVWLDCTGKRPWLITPEQPETFVRALSRLYPLE